MNEFQLATLAFMSWMIEKEHGRDELAEMWADRFLVLMDDVEFEFMEKLGEE